MEFAKLMEQVIAENQISLKRRCNMMGQHLANVGFVDVEVELEVRVKVRDPHGSGTSEQTINGTYKKFQAGFGPQNIGGDGTLVDQDGLIPPVPSQTAPALPQVSRPPQQNRNSRPSAWGQAPD